MNTSGALPCATVWLLTGAKYSALQKLAADAFAHDPPASQLALSNEFHALVVAVGKQHCGSRARCEGCPLSEFANPAGESTF